MTSLFLNDLTLARLTNPHFWEVELKVRNNPTLNMKSVYAGIQ